MTAALTVTGLQVRYGALTALRDLSLSVERGERLVVLGLNGAGKSSLLNTIEGLVRPARGVISFAGLNVTRLRIRQRMRRGMILVAEGRQILSSLSVERNLELGGSAHRALCGPARGVGYDLVWEMFPTLRSHRHQIAGSLSGGEQQMLAIGRALLGGPELLMIDEPTLGLSPASIKILEESLRGISATGITLIVSEQNLRAAVEMADRVVVLNRGYLRYERVIGNETDYNELTSELRRAMS